MSINLDRIAKFLGAKNFANEDVVKKGLEKIAPRLKGFFNSASKYGYPAGAAIGFLQNQFSKDQPVDESLRPDQAANMELQRQSAFPQRVLGAVGRTALGAASGGLGGAAISSLGSALDQEQQPSQQQNQQEAQSPAYDPLSGFKDYPELTEFIRKEHANGGNALSIGSKARKSSKLSAMVADIEKKAGEEFESLLERLLGGQPSRSQQQQQGQRQGSPAMSQFLQALQEYKKLTGM